MKELNKTIGKDRDNDNTGKSISNVARLATDLDKIDEADTSPRQLNASGRASDASYSLGRLEQDLQQLQSKWYAVEMDIAERDKTIVKLEETILSYQEKAATFEAALNDVTTAKTALSEELAAAQVEIRDRCNKNETLESVIGDREADLAAAKSDFDELHQDKVHLQEKFDRHKKSAASNVNRINQLDAQNVELRVHVQELQDYIDGRKNDWDELTASLRDYENTIQGMQTELGSHDEIVAAKEAEKAELAAKVMDLERDLAEIKGRYAERESGFTELQQTLKDQSRELGNLKGEAMRLHKTVEKLKKKLDRRETEIQTLRQELEDKHHDSSSLESMLADEKSTVAELRAKLDATNQRISALETEQQKRDSTSDELGVTIGELRERLRLSEPTIAQQETRIEDLQNCLQESEAAQDGLRAEIAQAATDLEEVSGRAAEFEIRSAELEAVLLEKQADTKDLEGELAAQRELVQVLECELSNKQDNLDILDRSADRLSAIGHGIRDLDLRIDDLWQQHGESVPLESREIFDDPDDDMLEPDALLLGPEDMAEHVIVSEDQDGSQTCYPLVGMEMTIGRSRKNDIRLNSKYISRVHARIRLNGDTVTIEDAGSTNGFLVNAVHSTHHTLSHGDRLEIGMNRLRYLHLPAGK